MTTIHQLITQAKATASDASCTNQDINDSLTELKRCLTALLAPQLLPIDLGEAASTGHR